MAAVSWFKRPEQVVMSLEQYRMRCLQCGSRDVAVSTWERLVEFPDEVWMHPDWPLPLQPHVCAQANSIVSKPRYRTVEA